MRPPICPPLIDHIRKSSRHIKTEIIVVDGQSQDNTFDIAKKKADRAVVASQSGRAYQMHEGAKLATGDIFVFLHADTRLPINWQAVLLKAWSKPPPPPPPRRLK